MTYVGADLRALDMKLLTSAVVSASTAAGRGRASRQDESGTRMICQ